MSIDKSGNEEMEIKLWEFIDGLVANEERSSIEQLIATNTAWKQKYAELLELHGSLNLVELEQPSMRFTRNVMEEIAKYQIAPATKSYLNNKIIWSIGLFFITMLAGFLIYGIAQIDWAAGTESGTSLGIDLSKVDYSRMFNNDLMNVFMMLNVVLGLFLLDRLLANKRKKYITD